MIAAMRDISWPMREPSNMSRTTARASTMAPDAPTACKKRAAIRVSMENASAQASEATR